MNKISAKDLSIIFPCYNESPVFEDSVKKVTAFMDTTGIDYEIIFVDDKSSDNTPDLIRALLKYDKRFSAIFHERNIGRGGSVSDGLKSASGVVAGYMDIDLEIKENYLGVMYNAVCKGNDVVCAKRFYDKSLRYFLRDFLHGVYLRLANILVSIPVSDPNAGCKFFRREKILPVLEKTVDRHWFWDTEIVKRASSEGLKITEVPVKYVHNINKKSSVRVFSDTLHFIRKLFWLRKAMK